jgi:molybdate-binding protein/DNA-binding XRE family transcriptional regulator
MLENMIREQRARLGWTQEELARRSGLSRTGIGAIESGRLVPSTAAALSLASAFGCRVEDLFRLPQTEPAGAAWAWSPSREPSRFWRAEVGSRTLLYPVEATPLGVIPHDGVHRDRIPLESGRPDAPDTLVIACCDPAVGLLAAEMARSTGIRLIALPRSSRAALDLLGKGLVHAAGVHLGRSDDPGANAAAVHDAIGPGFSLLRVARWEEGVASLPGLGLSSIGQAIGSGLRWIAREPGSGARQCLDELLEGHPTPKRRASDHRGVAEAIRSGWADVGVCLRLAGEEAGLDFFGVREEGYDLCFTESSRDDRRIRTLIEVVRSGIYRRQLGELPGYDSSEAGELRSAIS